MVVFLKEENCLKQFNVLPGSGSVMSAARCLISLMLDTSRLVNIKLCSAEILINLDWILNDLSEISTSKCQMRKKNALHCLSSYIGLLTIIAKKMV